MIIVSLIAVVTCNSLVIYVFSARVITPSVLLHLLFCGVIPCHIRLLYTVKGQQFDKRIVGSISTLHEI